MRIDAKGHDGNKDSYFGVIEEIWELDYGPLKIPLFRCQWVNRTGGGVTIDRYGMMLGSLDRSQDRENTLRTKVKTLEYELHCSQYEMFQPVQRWVGGGIYTPNLITSFQKCPCGPHEGQEVTTGVFGNFPRLDSPTWILSTGSRVFLPLGNLR